MLFKILFYELFCYSVIIKNDNRVSIRIRKPHWVPREARIRALILLENGINIPPPAQSCVVLPEFRTETRPLSKHLIVSLLPVEEVPIPPPYRNKGFGAGM